MWYNQRCEPIIPTSRIVDGSVMDGELTENIKFSDGGPHNYIIIQTLFTISSHQRIYVETKSIINIEHETVQDITR